MISAVTISHWNGDITSILKPFDILDCWLPSFVYYLLKNYIMSIIIIFHMDYLYTIYLWLSSHMPPISLGTDVTSSREIHSSSFFSSSSYAFL